MADMTSTEFFNTLLEKCPDNRHVDRGDGDYLLDWGIKSDYLMVDITPYGFYAGLSTDRYVKYCSGNLDDAGLMTIINMYQILKEVLDGKVS